MIIRTVTFVVKAWARERFEAKFRGDDASLKEWETCLGSEVWIEAKEGEETVTITALSRWEKTEDFMAWMKRPAQTDHHKAMREKAKADPQEESPIVSKKLQEFQVLA